MEVRMAKLAVVVLALVVAMPSMASAKAKSAEITPFVR